MHELRGNAIGQYPPPQQQSTASHSYEPGMNLRAASSHAPPSPSFTSASAPSAQVFQQPVYAPQQVQVVVVNMYKSKVAAGLLALFLGTLGIHRFYLGYNGIGLAQLLLCLGGWITCGATTIAAAIWAFIDMILIFTGGISKDAQGQPLI